MATAQDELIAAIRARASNEALRAELSPASLPSPARADQLARAEEFVGRSFPLLLRRLYLEIANGGFGPGCGLLTIGNENVDRDDHGETLLGAYRSMLTVATWPRCLMPAFDFGCSVWGCIDVSHQSGAIVTMASMRLVDTDWTLEGWFRDWVDGKRLCDEIHEPGTELVREGINPLTRERMLFRSSALLRGRVRPPLDPELAGEPR